MTLQITPITQSIGALISGINFIDELGDKDYHQIEQALLAHKVLFIRDQPITPDQQSRFASYFGELYVHPIFPSPEGFPQISELNNSKLDLRDNAIWHTDVTFLEKPAMGAVLSAKEVPSYGGDTLWASTEVAYEALSKPLQHFLEGLTATHDFSLSFPTERFASNKEDKERWDNTRHNHPSVIHPVVRKHPITGRKGLFVNKGFTSHINELSAEESQALLNLLFEHLARPEFFVRWQ